MPPTAGHEPWIGECDPSFEMGAIAMFAMNENRLIKVSSFEYPKIGQPIEPGATQLIRDITEDPLGDL